MKIKTNELTGDALDWAVAVCESDDTVRIYFDDDTGEKLHRDEWPVPEFSPSTDWAQGGPIIERERISLVAMPDGSWQSQGRDLRPHFHNPTPLIAAMRAFVASKLGDTVDIPEGLQ